MPSEQAIIGIDPGTQAAGYAIITNDSSSQLRTKILDMGRIRLPRQLSPAVRLSRLHAATVELARQHQPQSAVIEKAFFGLNAVSALRLGEARGALITALTSVVPTIKVLEITPTQVKKHITSNGHATKQQVANALARLLQLNLDQAPSDATDALALACCHHLAATPRRAMPIALNARAKHESAPLSSVGRLKKGRAQLSYVPATLPAMPQQSGQNNEN